MLKKNLRLPKQDFSSVLKTGKTKKQGSYCLYYKKNNLQHNRFGLVVGPKYFSSQTEKNLFKRRLTSILNQMSISDTPSYDIVVRVVNRPESIDFNDLNEFFNNLLTKIF